MAKSRGKSPVAKEMAVATGLGNLDFLSKKERHPAISVKLFPLFRAFSWQWIWVAGCGRSAYPLVGLVERKTVVKKQMVIVSKT